MLIKKKGNSYLIGSSNGIEILYNRYLVPDLLKCCNYLFTYWFHLPKILLQVFVFIFKAAHTNQWNLHTSSVLGNQALASQLVLAVATSLQLVLQQTGELAFFWISHEFPAEADCNSIFFVNFFPRSIGPGQYICNSTIYRERPFTLMN